MSIEKELKERSTVCELCGASDNLSPYAVSPKEGNSVADAVLICQTCKSQIEDLTTADSNHWRCLNDSMWSTIPAVQVVAWRMLNALKSEGWTQDLLDMLYLDDEVLAWAKQGLNSDEFAIVHKDSNGVTLQSGDTVVLTKDLNVKGAGFTAKRGTAVRNISLVHDNPEHIEGRVNGQQIVILTKFVKKS